MADNNENKQTVEEILAAAIERQHCQRPPRTITPEQLKAMAAERQRQKRRRLLRTAGFAAVFVIAVISTALLFNMITVDVGADKNAKEEIRTENGVVIEDGGWGSSSENIIITTESSEIQAYKKAEPRLIILNYVPENYNFEKLSIEKIEIGDTICEYVYTDINNKFILEIEEYIQASGASSLSIDNIAKVLACQKGQIYIQGKNDNKRAIIQLDDGIIIKIWTVLPDDELIKIIESISY